jgi:hypothetical protein
MAAQAWKFYNLAKKKIGNGSISLASTVMRMSLVTSASNFATRTLGTFASLTNEIADRGAAYSTSGKSMTGEVWTVGASAQQYKWDADDIVWTATVTSIANIKGAVIWVSGASAGARHLVAFASLTSNQFTLAIGNTLTVQINSNGIATLT